LKQEIGSTDLSTLAVTGPGSGLAAVVVEGAAVVDGAEVTTVAVLVWPPHPATTRMKTPASAILRTSRR
jgi:hypothetical protein